ncbi:helix-turn-helix domain-containing protein [Methylophaga sp. OBS4]|uniref:helix-turn-helix domain-containing protein n=1 Tax=Methylophaga sp. OBS4 TaxID=2991935 RepID=UPI00225C215A|nr:helix-turn-helix domain-containing protein [Methylophaga sp. OBS4]MCX4187978.1 helix-turn-helix domain-containing protein [Methylophaga sp. OBS4]
MEQNKAGVAPERSSNASNWGILEATDPDEQAHNLRNWQQQYDQISRGPFYGRIEEVSSKRIHAFREHTSQTVRQQCNVWPNSVWLGFSSDEKSCRINGHQVNHQLLIVRPGDTQFELVTPEEFNIFGIVVSQESLHEVAQKQGIILDATVFNSPLRAWQSRKLNILRYVLNELLKPEHAGLSRPIQEENLIMAVLDVLQQNDGQIHEKPSFIKRRAVVEKVSAYLEAHPDKPFTITELCELTHVSRRTMQYCFEDVLGISPLRCIRISRLNAVRRRLLQGLEEGETISMVAQQWGFLHAGQFTHDYTRLFGENPSVTLIRSQN